jgi:hypothetical protein
MADPCLVQGMAIFKMEEAEFADCKVREVPNKL